MRAASAWCCSHHVLTLIVMAAVMALTTAALLSRPTKSYFPTDDTGLIYGGTVAPTETSFETMFELQQRAAEVVHWPIRPWPAWDRRSATSAYNAVHQPRTRSSSA
mgnify:CR=1 FL=1